MRKRWKMAALLLAMTGILAGCGRNSITIADLKNTAVEKYVTLPDYKNLAITQPEKVEITDADVKYNVYTRINAVNEMRELTGTVENGDVVNIDFAGTIDGTAFQGGTAQGYILEIGSGSFIAGFEEGLIGANVGETKELSLRFPDDYSPSPDLAGRDCIFAVKINHILTELTDENVSLVDPGYQNAAEYWADAETTLIESVKNKYETELRNSIAISLMAGCTYEEIPESLVEDYKTALQKEYESIAASVGITAEQYVMRVHQVAAEDVEDTINANALWCAKEGLAIQAIANAEELSVSDEEVEEIISEYIAKGTAEENLDKETVRVNLLYNKVFDFLADIYKK